MKHKVAIVESREEKENGNNQKKSFQFEDLPPDLIVFHILEFYEILPAAPLFITSEIKTLEFFGYFKYDKFRNIFYLFSSIDFGSSYQVTKHIFSSRCIDFQRVKRISIEMNIYQRFRTQFSRSKLSAINFKSSIFHLAADYLKESYFNIQPINSDFFKELAHQTKIKRLTISKNFRDYPRPLQFKPVKFQNLKFLTIRNAGDVFSNKFVTLNQEKLERIEISDSMMNGDWGKLPNLKHILIDSCRNFKYSIFGAEQFKKLKTIEIRCIDTPIDLSKWKPALNLRELVLFHCKVKSFYSCSHYFPNVEELEICTIVDDFIKENNYKSISFKKLKRIILKSKEIKDLRLFMDNNQFPYLKKMY